MKCISNAHSMSAKSPRFDLFHPFTPKCGMLTGVLGTMFHSMDLNPDLDPDPGLDLHLDLHLDLNLILILASGIWHLASGIMHHFANCDYGR